MIGAAVAKARRGSSWPLGLRRVAVAASRLPVVRQLRLVQLRRLRPLADGGPRGTPIVRHHWARFLDRHRADVRGRALEVGTTRTIREYGGERISHADAIDLTAHSPEVTVVADLALADDVPSDTWDCFVNQFTMHVIFDVESALYHAIRVLRPGGVLLANFSSVDAQLPRGLDMATGGTMWVHWSFTPLQVDNLLRRAGLDGADYELEVFGNLFSRVAYEMNLSAEELTRRELDEVDRAWPVLICVRAVKPPAWHAERPEPRRPWLPDVAPARWDPVTGHYAT